MTEKKEGILDEIKEILPEIDFENLDTMSGAFQDLSSRMKHMEEREANMVEAMKQMSIIFSENAKKLNEYEESRKLAANAKFALAETVVKANSQFLKVDYDALLTAMKAANPSMESVIEERVLKSAKKTAALDEFAATVAGKLEPDIGEVDWSDYVAASDVAEYVDHSDIAMHLWDSFDPSDYWGSDDLAQHYCPSEIAEYVEAEYIAEYIDKDDVAERVAYDSDLHNAIAKKIDYHLLVKKGLDMENVVKGVVETILPVLTEEVMKLFGQEEEE